MELTAGRDASVSADSVDSGGPWKVLPVSSVTTEVALLGAIELGDSVDLGIPEEFADGKGSKVALAAVGAGMRFVDVESVDSKGLPNTLPLSSEDTEVSLLGGVCLGKLLASGMLVEFVIGNGGSVVSAAVASSPDSVRLEKLAVSRASVAFSGGFDEAVGPGMVRLPPASVGIGTLVSGGKLVELVTGKGADVVSAVDGADSVSVILSVGSTDSGGPWNKLPLSSGGTEDILAGIELSTGGKGISVTGGTPGKVLF